MARHAAAERLQDQHPHSLSTVLLALPAPARFVVLPWTYVLACTQELRIRRFAVHRLHAYDAYASKAGVATQATSAVQLA